MSRRDDLRFDAEIHDRTLRELGVLEPDEPTEVSHRLWMSKWNEQASGEFTADERQQIRRLLKLGPFAGDTEEGSE